jgi:hypothetical protein
MKKVLLILMLMGCSGCAADVHVADVTHDPRFLGAYDPGQVWRLRTEGYLVQSADNGLELWSPADAVGQNGAVKIPAGSTVRIERLGYLYNSEHPATPGGTVEMVWSYGTLTEPDGKQWQVMVLPSMRDGRLVEGTSLVVYPPDLEFLDEVGK